MPELSIRAAIRDHPVLVVVLVPEFTGSHLTGLRFQIGHGGTTTRNVKAVPANPMYIASMMSCLTYPMLSERSPDTDSIMVATISDRR